MCNPTAALYGGSMGLSMIGGFLNYQNIKDEGDAAKAYYDLLAKGKEVDADRVMKRSEDQVKINNYEASLDESELRSETKKLEGRQKTVQAASGVYGDSVTAQDIAYDTATKEAMDKSVIRYNANMKSWATKIEAIDTAFNLKREAGYNRISGEMARKASRTAAVGSILGSASQIANTGAMWYSSRGK